MESPPLPPPPPGGPGPLGGAGTPRRSRPWLVASLTACILLTATVAAGQLVSRPSAGPQGAHAFLGMYLGGPVHWDPCEPIHYVVNATQGPAEALHDVHQALERVSDATGLTFVDDGASDWTATRQLSLHFFDLDEGFLPVLVVWTGHREFVEMAHTTHAAAFAIPHPGSGPDAGAYHSGVVVVDATVDIPPGTGGRYALVPVLMHEFGHLVGLGHVVDGHQLMYSRLMPGAARYPDLTQTDWGPGDLQGLRELGGSGCAN